MSLTTIPDLLRLMALNLALAASGWIGLFWYVTR